MAEMWSGKCEYFLVKRSGEAWTRSRHQRGFKQAVKEVPRVKKLTSRSRKESGGVDQSQKVLQCEEIQRRISLLRKMRKDY